MNKNETSNADCLQRLVRRRPAPILPTLRDTVKPGGYEGAIMRYSPKRKIIVRIFDENLKEMRFKKHLIYDALKNQYLIGQVKRDEIGTKKCVGYAIGHVLVRRKGCAIHIMRVKEWRKLQDA